MKFPLLILSLTWLASASAAAPPVRPLPAYAPLWLDAARSAAEPGTLPGDFAQAQRAPDWIEAVARWSGFLKRHEPGDAGFEDAVHVRLVLLARMELMRALYLLGKIPEADALARRIGAAALGEKEP